MRALALLYKVLLSYPSGDSADHYGAFYKKIFGEDSDSKDDSEYVMDDINHELDGESANKDSDATSTSFQLINVELPTMAISHIRYKDGRLSLTEDKT